MPGPPREPGPEAHKIDTLGEAGRGARTRMPGFKAQQHSGMPQQGRQGTFSKFVGGWRRCEQDCDTLHGGSRTACSQWTPGAHRGDAKGEWLSPPSTYLIDDVNNNAGRALDVGHDDLGGADGRGGDEHDGAVSLGLSLRSKTAVQPASQQPGTQCAMDAVQGCQEGAT
jgi:hypothetical protein